MTAIDDRLTSFAHGGGCACKIPPGELEEAVKGLTGQPGADVLVGLDDGDDASAVRVRDDLAVLSTADFFTPVVDDAYDWGRIAAANALSDIYAMGGTPITAINLVGWPREKLPMELLTEVLRGGLDVAAQAKCPVAGGHSIDDPEPKYGMAVTGIAHPDELMRNDAAEVGLPLTLTKPIGVGILNNRHKQTGEYFAEAVATMTALNAKRHVRHWPQACARPRMSPASGCSATCSRCAVPQASVRSSTRLRSPASAESISRSRTGMSPAVLVATSTGCVPASPPTTQ